MTVATYTTNLTEIVGDTQTNSTSGWTALGGGASGLNAGETDAYIEGSQCMSKNAFASSEKGMIYDAGSDQGGSGTDGAYSMWLTHLVPNEVNTIANGGISFLIGSSTSAYHEHYVGGSDTLEFGGWIFAAVSEQQGFEDNTAGTPSTTVEQTFGALFDLPTGGPTKGAPNIIDTVRVGRHDIVIEHGTGADPEATFDGVITSLETPTNRWGMLVNNGGAFYNSGLVQFGSSTNAVEFTDGNKTIFIRDHPHAVSNFNTWEVQNASSVITLTNLVVQSLGTQSPGRWVTTDNATMTWDGCLFVGLGTFGFNTNATISATTFLQCGQITHGGATMNGSSVLESSVAADEGALYYDETADPDGEMDNMTFSKGANAHHAIRFGTNVPTSITLRNCDFSGFGASDDANDSVFRFDDTGGNITLNLVGCTHDGSGFTVDDAAGVTVTVVEDPVTVKVTTADVDGNAITGAYVHVRASNGTGPLPYQDSVSISRTTTTATVTHSSHGLKTNDKIYLRGISDKTEDNGVQQITFIDANSYSFTTTDSGSTSYTGTNYVVDGQDETSYDNSPASEGTFSGGSGHSVNDVLRLGGGTLITVDAVSSGVVTQFTVNAGPDGGGHTASDTLPQRESTGSGTGFSITLDTDNIATLIKCTYVALDGTTDGAGEISTSRTFSSAQPVVGWTRKSTSAPYYQNGSVSDSISSTEGLDFTAVMGSDE